MIAERTFMKETILEKVPRILEDTLDKSKKYLAAVSGGADSLAMADALQRAGFDFAVCHVEHGIRGKESLEDARFVEAFCRQRGLSFYCRTVRVPEFRDKEKLSLEDAARRLRYQELERCARETGADFILTAHQKDDQAETFLLRLLRGSGTRGLGAIRFERNRILRPLLRLTGDELRQYCTARLIIWRNDVTNQDIRYARNRIRKLVIPLLKENFSPAVTDILCRTASHLQMDSIYLEEEAEKELQKRILFSGPERSTSIRTDSWETIPKALRFRILQQFWHSAGGKEEISCVNLDDMERLVETRNSGKKILLPDGWQVLCSYDKLILFSPEQLCYSQKDNGWNQTICWDSIPEKNTVGGNKGLKIGFPDGRAVYLYVVKGKPFFKYRMQMIYPLHELKQLGDHLEFRFRKAGDRIFPLKGTGHKTLKKFLIECKVPVEAREQLVVAAAGSEIVWIPGLANARWSMTEDTECREQSWLFIDYN